MLYIYSLFMKLLEVELVEKYCCEEEMSFSGEFHDYRSS